MCQNSDHKTLLHAQGYEFRTLPECPSLLLPLLLRLMWSLSSLLVNIVSWSPLSRGNSLLMYLLLPAMSPITLQVNKKSYRLRKGGHIKRKGDKIGMEYEARHCEHADTSRDNHTNVTWRFISPRQQYRVCVIVSGSVSMLTMSSYLCFIFHPYISCLLSFLCHPYMPSYS